MTRKIRVMQLGSPTGLYGAERWILALIRHLDPCTVESIVGAVKDEPGLTVPLCTEAAQMGFRTTVFQALGRLNPDAVRQIRRFIAENRIDILHTHGYKQDLMGLAAVAGTRCRIVSTPHGWSRDAGFRLLCYESLNRLVFPFFDAVVPLSREMAFQLKNIPFIKSRLRFIQNGVDTQEIASCRTTAPEMVRIRREGGTVIGYIGRLVSLKGLDTLLHAVASLDKPVHLVLVGEGEEREPLKALAVELKIEKQVHFTGFRENRLEFLNGFDLFVLPSLTEGIPRCLMEAMAAGVPALASRIPGCQFLVKAGKTGQLFFPGDALDLSAQLNWCIDHPADVGKMAETARKFILAEFSAATMADRYKTLFLSLMRNTPAPIECKG